MDLGFIFKGNEGKLCLISKVSILITLSCNRMCVIYLVINPRASIDIDRTLKGKVFLKGVSHPWSLSLHET